MEPNWIVLARIEGDESIFRKEDRITADELRAMAESYDPNWRLAPVISGYNEKVSAGPGHFEGEFHPPLGFVRGLDFDGLNLWGLIDEQEGEDGVGRVSAYVAQGFLQRSIGWWRKSPEVGDRPYLRHVALLGGEQPGIPNLPSLGEYFRSVAGGDELQGRIVASAPFCVRNMVDNPRLATPPEGAEKTKGDEIMDETQVRSLVASIMAEQPKPASATDIASAVKAAVDAAVAPLNAQIETLRTEQKAIETRVTENVEAARTAEIDRRVDGLVSSGRLSPAEAKDERELFDGLGHEKITKRLATLERRAPNLRISTPASIEIGEGEDVVSVPLDQRAYSLPGIQVAVDPTGIRAVAEAKASSQGKPENFRAALISAATGRN